MTMQLSRQQRRAMQRHAVEAEQATDADRKFFERFPHRQYRMRRMGRAEISQLEAICGGSIVNEPGDAPFVLIKNIAPGVRLRAFVPGPADEDGSDAPEQGIAILWAQHAARHPAVAEKEGMLRWAAALPGGPLHDGGGR
ncbi:hypothetical protein MKK64_11905 [Methylobacterium sp. E-025]|uniref:hypothetical protein n=1 Tax=Methylobacterium sp. E-025 TaxID=2836561 RepID=UPI001FBB3D0E|nr:hypothetical protein [Methylobacterium sp. E-025]MCJ2111901.1 hypothetical protein [Methylobacterium sp. E-025]